MSRPAGEGGEPPVAAPLWQLPTLDLPGLDVDATCDVAVVGGGITGLTAAAALAAAGLDVRVLESRYLGAGTTGGTTAKVSLAQGLRFSGLRRLHGDDALGGYARAGLAGQQAIRERCERNGVPIEQRDGVTYATTPHGRELLEQELAAMRAAELPAELRERASLPLASTGALVLPDQSQFEPGRYLGALASDALGAGAQIHERTTVEGMSSRGRAVLRCSGPGGERRVTAMHVLLATGLPMLDRGGFFAREEPHRSYCVAVRVRGRRPAGMFLSVDQPTRSIRTAGRDHLVIGGNGHVVGRVDDTDRRLDDLEGWAAEHFDVVATTHRWAAQDYGTADGLPYVGRLLPWRDDVLVASGFDKWGMTTGTAAGIALADTVRGESPEWARGWDPWRRNGIRQAPAVLKFNAAVAWRLLQGWSGAIVPSRGADLGDLAEGEGEVRLSRRGPVAVSRVDGQTRSVSAVCTHLGGIVRWNPGERSWDCPLHGSRFAPDGRRLEGPASEPLHDLQPRPG